MNTKIVFSGDEKASRLFLKMHLEKYTPLKKTYAIIGIVALVLGIILLIFDTSHPYWIISLVVSILMPFLYISQRNSLIDKSINKRATYDQVATFKNSLILFNYANTEKTFEYNQIIRFIELPDYVYLYIEDTKAIIIPKLQIQKDEMDNLINHLHDKIANEKYKYYNIKK